MLAITDGKLEWNCRNFDLSHASEKHVNVEYLRGLINVVLLRGDGDRAGRFCIGRFAIDMYCKLLDERQKLHLSYCRTFVFLPSHDQVWCGVVQTCCQSVVLIINWWHGMHCAQAWLNRADVIPSRIWPAFTKADMSHVSKVRNTYALGILWCMSSHMRWISLSNVHMRVFRFPCRYTSTLISIDCCLWRTLLARSSSCLTLYYGRGRLHRLL